MRQKGLFEADADKKPIRQTPTILKAVSSMTYGFLFAN